MEQDNLEPIEIEVSNAPEVVEVEEPKVPERPWKQKPEAIPYDRFKEVNDKAKANAERAEALERRLAEIEARQNSKPALPEIKDVDDIKPDDFKDEFGNTDNYAWLKAREKFIQEQTIKTWETRVREQKQAEEYRATEEKIASDFNARLEESMKHDPEIKDAVEWFSNQYGSKLSPQIRYALVTDENAPELIFHLATDPAIMQMIQSGRELDAIKAMSKWSAKYTREEAPVKENEEPETYKPSKTAPVTKPSRKGTASPAKDPEKMSKEEYRAWRASQR